MRPFLRARSSRSPRILHATVSLSGRTGILISLPRLVDTRRHTAMVNVQEVGSTTAGDYEFRAHTLRIIVAGFLTCLTESTSMKGAARVTGMRAFHRIG